MEFSTDTCLFGSIPVQPLERTDEFAQMIDQQYELVSPKPKAEPSLAKIGEQKNAKNPPKAQYKEIRKYQQSQGSKIFAILTSKKLQPKKVAKETESVGPVVPKRKLGMSKH